VQTLTKVLSTNTTVTVDFGKLSIQPTHKHKCLDKPFTQKAEVQIHGTTRACINEVLNTVIQTHAWIHSSYKSLLQIHSLS